MRDVYNELAVQFKTMSKTPKGDGAENLLPLGESMGDENGERLKPENIILKKAPDESWVYALDPDRQNAADFIGWDEDMDVLMIGASYGIYLPIADRVKSFSVLDKDKAHREYIRAKISLDNNAGIGLNGNADVRLIEKLNGECYDAVILSLLDNDALAEAIVNLGITDDGTALGYKDESAKPAALKKIFNKSSELLKDGGIFVLIADNDNALKFFTGAKKRPDRTYVTAEEISEAALSCGFGAVKKFYPIKCAENGRMIFSDKRLPGRGDFRGINESFFESRYVLCSDEAIYGGLCEAGAFTGFAPSFVTVCSKGTDERLYKIPIYAKYNRMRDERYALKTEIFEENGEKKVIKTALSKAASHHISAFKEREDILNKELCGRINVLSAKLSEDKNGIASAEFPYINGTDLGSVLADGISFGKAPEQKIKESIGLILGNETKLIHGIDNLFENVLVDGGSYTLIDYEWISEDGVERDYAAYRMLRYWYEAHENMLTAYDGLTGFLRAFGLNEEDIKRYALMELDFQNKVRGIYKDIEERFTKVQLYAYDIENRLNKLTESLEKIELLESEIKEHKTALKKEREVERLSQNHIRNIEHINKIREDEIAALSAKVDYLAKHQSMGSKLAERIIARVDRWAPADSKKRVIMHYAKDTIKHPVSMLSKFLSGEGRLLISGDLEIRGEFHEGGILRIPEAKEPLISIVIPAYDQVAYTYACIRSIIENTDFSETPYEVILADDFSKDATKNISKYIKGLIIKRGETNLGFLKNCNNAASYAKGKYIFFLNNDTKVHKNCLSSLVNLIESDDSIGMVGSKLIYPDGRLQEAGGIIWQDASGWNFGRLDDPDKPEYNYVKDVDYISGAAIMLSKKLWDEIGGFDERYAPAYCEDSDLAFEVRKRGKRVVYQPQSVVTHFEGISNGTDVNGTGLKRYQIVNAEKFKEKWSKELKNQEINTGNPDPFTARDRSKEKRCIAVIDHYVPTWDKDAGSRTAYQYLKMFLKKGFNVKFIGDNFLREEPYTSALQQLGIEVLYGKDYEDSIFDWFKKNNSHIDICYLNRPHIAVKYIDFLKKETDIKCIFYGHDLHFMRLMREYELTGDTAKLRESNYWKSVEFSVMQEADISYYPSELEIEAIGSIHPEYKCRAITAYLWDEFKLPKESVPYEDRKDILFVGGFKHPPNKDAVLWFVREVFPKIRAEIPEIRFLVAGSGADDEIKAIGSEDNGVDILGFVTDEKLTELYGTTRLVVVPLRYGAGVKGKVVEAIYNNSAIVTTPVGSEGIPEAENAMLIVSGNPEEIMSADKGYAENFAMSVAKAYNDKELCEKLASGCGTFIKKHYSMEAAWSVIKEDFGDSHRGIS